MVAGGKFRMSGWGRFGMSGWQVQDGPGIAPGPFVLPSDKPPPARPVQPPPMAGRKWTSLLSPTRSSRPI